MNTVVEQAYNLIDQANRQDPNYEIVDGQEQPKEWIYGVRMSECLDQFMPEAPAELKIAARAQHIKRWSVPRSNYPMGRQGYQDWRVGLGKYHAEQAMDIATSVGCNEQQVEAIGRMLRKEKIKREPLVQALEDVACLVFLRFYFEAFTAKHPEDKICRIVKKTWAKMSENGHEAALKLPFTHQQQTLLAKALG